MCLLNLYAWFPRSSGQKNYETTKNFIKEVRTACLWKKKSSKFEPDFCPIKLDSDPWIVQPTEHYEDLSIQDIIKKSK